MFQTDERACAKVLGQKAEGSKSHLRNRKGGCCGWGQNVECVQGGAEEAGKGWTGRSL